MKIFSNKVDLAECITVKRTPPLERAVAHINLAKWNASEVERHETKRDWVAAIPHYREAIRHLQISLRCNLSSNPLFAPRLLIHLGTCMNSFGICLYRQSKTTKTDETVNLYDKAMVILRLVITISSTDEAIRTEALLHLTQVMDNRRRIFEHLQDWDMAIKIETKRHNLLRQLKHPDVVQSEKILAILRIRRNVRDFNQRKN